MTLMTASGRGKTQGLTRGTAPAEDGQRVSLQLAHGATEDEGVKVALSLGGPASLPSTADLLPADKPGQQPSIPPLAFLKGAVIVELVTCMGPYPAGWHWLSFPVRGCRAPQAYRSRSAWRCRRRA